MPKIIFFILTAVITFNICLSQAHAVLVSPFLPSTEGELDSVTESDEFVVIIELKFANLKKQNVTRGFYTAHIYSKANQNWQTVEGVESALYLDGGSREIDFLLNNSPVKIELPSTHSRSKGEEPRMSIGERMQPVIRYGASGIGIDLILPLVTPLYSPQEQEYIQVNGTIRNFDPDKRVSLLEKAKLLFRNKKPTNGGGPNGPYGIPQISMRTCRSIFSR